MIKKRLALVGLVGLLALSSCGTEMEYVVGTLQTGSSSREHNFQEEDVEGEIHLAATIVTEPSEDYNYSSDNFINSTAKLNTFSGLISNELLKNSEKNSAVSPLSIYMALAMTESIASGDTKNEILKALNMTEDEVKAYVKALMYYSNKEDTNITEILANSIWLNSSVEYKNEAIETLANDYVTSSYSADFTNNNAIANDNIRRYVRNNTKGLINRKFDLPTTTTFALINTLYYKDAWASIAGGLSETTEKYDFIDADGNAININLIQGNYSNGKVVEREAYNAFYSETLNNYKLTFVVPNDNYSITDVFNAETIAYVNSKEFKEEIKNSSYDSSTNTYYETRCLFPGFRAQYGNSIVGSLKNLGISTAFSSSADFSNLTNMSSHVSTVVHATKLKVDKAGIEGAAVTVVGGETTSVGPTKMVIRDDFYVTKEFGYVISDNYGIPLFTGIVNEI